jgi:RNA polymerase sigma-B factor
MAVMGVAARAVPRAERHSWGRSQGVSSAPGPKTSRDLLYEYHRGGDLQARERLIRRYMPLVKSLARRYAGRGEQVEDLVQVGAIGLINAIDRFELDRGVDISAYAIPSIVGEIKRHLRDRVAAIRIPRRLQEMNVSLKASARRLAAAHERPPTVGELADDAGVGLAEVLETLAAAKALEPVSLAEQANGDAGRGLELPGSTEQGYETGENRAVLARGFRALDERERRLLHLAYFEGMSQHRIADEVGLSQVHVSRLTRGALEKLRTEVGAS